MPLFIVQGDIAKQEADVLVNAANRQLKEGAGVCGAVFRGAGRQNMRAACDAIGFCQTGQAVITPAFSLPARHVIHTVGPVYTDGNPKEAEALRSCYLNSLQLAKEHGAQSIAFPLISAGVYGYPRGKAMEIAMAAILDFLKEEEDEPTVTLVLYDKADLRLDPRLRMGLDYLLRGREAQASPSAAIKARRRFPRFSRERNEAQSRGIKRERTPAPAAPIDDIPLDASLPMEADFSRREAPALFTPVQAPRSLEELVGRLDESFSVTLLRLIDSQGKTDPQVYKRANLNRKLFSKIRSNPEYRPSKNTVLALAIALELDRPKTQDLLQRAGFALSTASKLDVIVGFFIDRGVFDIHTINETLYYYDQPLLGEAG
jgi:O-acetyl-ADP-ribose deacetylase (regulator of RNase III)